MCTYLLIIPPLLSISHVGQELVLFTYVVTSVEESLTLLPGCVCPSFAGQLVQPCTEPMVEGLCSIASSRLGVGHERKGEEAGRPRAAACALRGWSCC